jgi:hypothetical protein
MSFNGAARSMKPRSAPDRADQAADEVALGEQKMDRAGSMDRAIEANTLAVSVLYCDWNMATDSGKVKCDGVLSTISGSR